eukprot:CAMPEP_0171987468 /NCGR_PEP_ID=MMETSP0993-20121228/275402_1 /TAXON_ID=483369 /ORGANISM="non described non described, Strain CCMP2098" /LENGTH=83 /DNA_ID=CAMNT_0012640409 /DNA_START=754 /DNA_END=1005 /DNA_ORIENTATION=+
MDSKLIDYGFEDSNGAAWTSIDNMIEAHGLKSNPPIAGAAGIVLAASKASGTEIITDSKLIGYGFEDSNGAAWTSIDNMIEAY